MAQALLTQGLSAAGATAGVVGLTDDTGQVQIVAIAGYDPDDHSYWRSFSIDDPYPMSDAIRERRPVIMRTVSERDSDYPTLVNTGEPADHPLVCLPLLLEDTAVGGVAVSFAPGSTFGPDRLAFLTAVADQAAQAIDRANAYDREQEARGELVRLAGISQALALTLDFRATITRVLELAATHLGANVWLYLLEGGKVVAGGSARRDPESGGVTVEPPHEGVVVAGERGEDVARRAIDGAEGEGERDDLLVLPLRIAGHPMGVLIVTGARPDPIGGAAVSPAFPSEVARRMARSLENAGAYRDRDHVARTLQRSLLPPALPRVPHLEVSALFKPALEAYDIGGDFYDVFQTPDGRWAAMIGDVCGKGIEAAALTSLARHTLRAAFRTGSPTDALTALNDALLQENLEGKFCTVCLVLIEPGAHGAETIVASAGHPLPQLVRADGSTESVGQHGTLLGVTPDVRLVDVRSKLEVGDTLVLYTDGLLERSRQHLDEVDQLRPVLSGHDDPAIGVRARIERYVDALTADEQDDDVAVLMLTAAP